MPVGTGEGEKWGAVDRRGRRSSAPRRSAPCSCSPEAWPRPGRTPTSPPAGWTSSQGCRTARRCTGFCGGSSHTAEPLTVLAVGPAPSASAPSPWPRGGDALLRRIGEEAREGRQRAFRYGDDEFVVVLGGASESRARQAALAYPATVSEEAGRPDNPPLAAVGWAFAETGDEDPRVLDAALRALKRPEAGTDGDLRACCRSAESRAVRRSRESSLGDRLDAL